PTDPAGTDNNPVLDGRKPVAAISYLTDALADRAVEFITREKSHPFFVYLAFNAPHVPLEATDRYLARFTNIANEHAALTRLWCPPWTMPSAGPYQRCALRVWKRTL